MPMQNEKNSIKSTFKRPYTLFSSFFFDPLRLIKKIKGLPFFIINLGRYERLRRAGYFKFRLLDARYASYDRFGKAANVDGHYFLQDLWAAEFLHKNNIKEHVDIGSRLDGFIAHILLFCKVAYIDILPLDIRIDGLSFRQGSILNLPFEDNSVNSLSSLHVIEHIGLGRYGDPVDPDGYMKAAGELARVLKPGGHLLMSTPVGGRERLCFDTQRIFDPQTILDAFKPLRLVEFLLIDDKGKGIIKDASMDCARRCNYGCGLFVFTKG